MFAPGMRLIKSVAIASTMPMMLNADSLVSRCILRVYYEWLHLVGRRWDDSKSYVFRRSHTRYKPWPKVEEFLSKLEACSLVADAGCGNGEQSVCSTIAQRRCSLRPRNGWSYDQVRFHFVQGSPLGFEGRLFSSYVERSCTTY